MKAAEYATGHYLEEGLQLHVPRYQRPYSWETDRLVDLWRDVANQYRASGTQTGSRSHFMGALIVEPESGAPTTGYTAVSVIDGQQRLLTMLVLLAAIRDQICYVNGKPVHPDNDLAQIRPRYGNPVPRVYPKAQDTDALQAILQGEFLEEMRDDLFPHRLSQAYRFFRYQLWLGRDSVAKHTLNLPPKPGRAKTAPAPGSYEPWGAAAKRRGGLDLPLLHSTIAGDLRLLELMVESTDEEAGVIFETMNAKSTPLSQFDLLRNSIFVRMPRLKDEFYEAVWQKVETTLEGVSYSSLRDKPQEQFFYEYSIGTGGAGISKDSMHRRWLSAVIEDLGFSVTRRSEARFRSRYVEPLARSADLYPIAVGQRRSVVSAVTGSRITVTESQLATIREIMAMSGGPVVPLILRGLSDRGYSLTDGQFSDVLRDLQSFLVRQMLTGEGFSPLRATMMVVASKLPTALKVSDLRQALRDADWKTDAEVRAAVLQLDTKEWKSAALFPILRGIERQLSGISAHPLPFGNKQHQFSIEHIYPQTENIGVRWESDLVAWKVSRDEIDARRYALGNLTAVTGYDNKRNGKKPFGEKQKLIAATANLKLHRSFSRLSKWTPDRIDKRTMELADAALKRWPRSS